MNSGIFHTTYQSDMALRRTHLQKIRIGVFLVLMIAFPFFANRYYLTLANQVAIATIGAIGLNILTGYTGQISLGQDLGVVGDGNQGALFAVPSQQRHHL